MMRMRLLVWIIAAIALLAPPGMTAHAMAPAGQAASVDCPDHAPPPDPVRITIPPGMPLEHATVQL